MPRHPSHLIPSHLTHPFTQKATRHPGSKALRSSGSTETWRRRVRSSSNPSLPTPTSYKWAARPPPAPYKWAARARQTARHARLCMQVLSTAPAASATARDARLCTVHFIRMCNHLARTAGRRSGGPTTGSTSRPCMRVLTTTLHLLARRSMQVLITTLLLLTRRSMQRLITTCRSRRRMMDE